MTEIKVDCGDSKWSSAKAIIKATEDATLVTVRFVEETEIVCLTKLTMIAELSFAVEVICVLKTYSWTWPDGCDPKYRVELWIEARYVIELFDIEVFIMNDDL